MSPMRFLKSLGNKVIDWALSPRARYRLLLPVGRLFQPDFDEQILDKAWRFVAHSKIEGDYLEFGVWKGRSFAKAYNLWWHLFGRKGFLKDMHFYAFDSFEGLPEITSSEDRQSGEFKKGDYFCSQEDFRNLVTTRGVDMRRVTMIPGWFDQVLNQKTKESLSLKKAAIIWIDCDLYESTVPVLDFITDHIQDGTVVIFDDWFAFRGNPNLGEQKAFREWLQRHPQITATEWQRVNWKSIAFIMHV